MNSQNSTPNDEAPPVDLRQLDQFICIGPSDFIEILGDVVADVSKHLVKMQASIKEGDLVDMKASAHSMRGMLSSLGCVGMTAMLHDLEYHQTPLPEDADAVHAKLDGLWQRSLTAIMDHARSIDGFLL